MHSFFIIKIIIDVKNNYHYIITAKFISYKSEKLG